MEYLARHEGTHVFNLGAGSGYSVSEVLAACQALFGGKPRASVSVRRPGDPVRLVASAEKACSELGWAPGHTLADAIEHASAWHRAQIEY